MTLWDIITNPEAIAVNQAWAGDPGERQRIWELGLARLGEQLAAARAAGGAAGKSQLLPRVKRRSHEDPD